MIVHRLAFSIALAVFLLLAAAGLGYAGNEGLMDPETARRTLQVLIGLIGVAYANVMPKRLGPVRRSPEAEARAQSALRVGGWSLTLAGLVYAGLWALAPLAIADVASMIVVAAALLLTFAYGGRSLMSCRAGAEPADGQRAS